MFVPSKQMIKEMTWGNVLYTGICGLRDGSPWLPPLFRSHELNEKIPPNFGVLFIAIKRKMTTASLNKVTALYTFRNAY